MDEDQATEGESPPAETPEGQPPSSGTTDAPPAEPTAAPDDKEDQPPTDGPDTQPPPDDTPKETADPATPQDEENVTDATAAEPSQDSATAGGDGDVPEADKPQAQGPEEPEGDGNANEATTEPIKDPQTPASDGDVHETAKEAQNQEAPEGDGNTDEVNTEEPEGDGNTDEVNATPLQDSETPASGSEVHEASKEDQDKEGPEGGGNANEVTTEPIKDSETPASDADVHETAKEAQNQEEPEGDGNTDEVNAKPLQDSETPASDGDVHGASKEDQDQEESEGDGNTNEVSAEPVRDSAIPGSDGDVRGEAREKALDQEEPEGKDHSTQLAESGGTEAEDKTVTAEVVLAVIEASDTAEDRHITPSAREEDGKAGEAVAMVVQAGSGTTTEVVMMAEGTPDDAVLDKQVVNMAKFIAEEVIAVGQAEVEQGMHPQPDTGDVAVSVPVPGVAPTGATTRTSSAGFRPYSETPQLSDGAPPATPEPPPPADRPCRGDWHNKTVDDLIKMGVPDLRLARCLDWGQCEIRGWLTGLGLPQYAEALLNNGICGRTLCLVTASNLPRMGITDWEHIKTIAGSARQLLSVDDYILYEQQWEKPPPGDMTRALFLQRAWPNGQPPPSSERYLEFLREFGFLDVLAEISNRPIVEMPQEQVNPLYKEITVASITSVASKQSRK